MPQLENIETIEKVLVIFACCHMVVRNSHHK